MRTNITRRQRIRCIRCSCLLGLFEKIWYIKLIFQNISIAILFFSGILSAGTSTGKVANWKHRFSSIENRHFQMDEEWRLQNALKVDEQQSSKIVDVAWSMTVRALAVNSIKSITILKERSISAHISNKVRLIYLHN